MRRRCAAALLHAWVLWAQTRTSAPGMPITDGWDIVDTFETRADCESARVALDPPRARREGEADPPLRTRFVCFPDTLDPQATP